MLSDEHGGPKSLSTLTRSNKRVYELIRREYARLGGFEQYHGGALGALREADEKLYHLLKAEYERLRSTLQLIAAENCCSRAVLAALGSVVQNKTTEGFVGQRFHGGCEVVDQIENLAAERARRAFGARYANVQPHSGTAANQIVLTALLEPNQTILSLGLDQGGHLSHGARVSFSGKFFNVEHYYVDRKSFLLDYDAIRETAKQVRPKLIICGASAYSRTIDFARFRAIADEVGAYLMADVSHIAGLIIAGAHPSPVDQAHVTTTSTYKPGGPRGGLILMGRDYDSVVETGKKRLAFWQLIEKATFPGVQGTPYLNNIAAKAVFLKETLSEEYKRRQFKIIENAKRLAQKLLESGYDVLTGGTDNHMLLVNVAGSRKGLTGVIAQKCLEDCGIVVNKNKLPYDDKHAAIASGMRLGTPIVTRNGMGPTQMDTVAEMIDHTLSAARPIGPTDYRIDDSFKAEMKARVKSLCAEFPMY